MADILEEIIAWKRIEIEQAKRQMPERALHAQVERIMAEDQPVASLKEALNTQGADKRRPPQIIAEFKRKSPSKGWIHQDAMAETVTIDYQLHGAAAVSILTDQKYFGGSDEFILNARRAGLTLPVLYKNFVVDEYQLFQAKACGASAVLLIAADLSIRFDFCHSITTFTTMTVFHKSMLPYQDQLPVSKGLCMRIQTPLIQVHMPYRDSLSPYMEK